MLSLRQHAGLRVSETELMPRWRKQRAWWCWMMMMKKMMTMVTNMTNMIGIDFDHGHGGGLCIVCQQADDCAADLKEQLSVLASVEALNWRKMPKSYKIDQVQYDKCFDKVFVLWFACFGLRLRILLRKFKVLLAWPWRALGWFVFVWLSVWFLYRFHLTTLRGASWGFLCDGRKVGAVGAAFAPAVAEKWGAEHGSMDYLWIWMLWDSMPDGTGSACKLAKY